MHNKPAILLSLLAAFDLAACASSDHTTAYTQPKRTFDTHAGQELAKTQFIEEDPHEGLNKDIYVFNAQLDRYALLPAVDAYKYVTPEFVRNRVTDFFANVGEFTNFTNAVFQLAPDKAGTTLGRFTVNSTVGLAGMFDVATDWGLERQPEDFGKTLGHWGVGSGDYLVLPLFGPSNVRDTVGLALDYTLMYFAVPVHEQDTWEYDVGSYAISPLDQRYNNSFRYYSTGSPFEYEMVRYIYTETRNQQIENERK